MKSKYRKLKLGEVVQVGDFILDATGKPHSAVTKNNLYVGFVIGDSTPHDFARPVVESAEDAVTRKLVAATERIRAKTTIGKLESLLADRSRWQRRQTIATTKLAEVQREIDRLASSLAKEKFDSELNSISNQSST